MLPQRSMPKRREPLHGSSSTSSHSFRVPQHRMLQVPTRPETLTNGRSMQRYGTYNIKYQGTARSMKRAMTLANKEHYPSRKRENKAKCDSDDPWVQIHPLKQQARLSSQAHKALPHALQSQLGQPQGLTSSVQAALRHQFYRILSLLKSRKNTNRNGFSSLRKHRRAVLIAFVPVLFAFVINVIFVQRPSHNNTRRFSSWKRLEDSRLESRQCVINFFVDKQAPDEFDPDVDEKHPYETPQRIAMEGTHRTKGEMKVISRFIGAVADTFRSEYMGTQQHIVFTGARDGGHLAEQAYKNWPSRGKYKTQLHVMASSSELKEWEYETIDKMERRFLREDDEAEHVHLYDASGNLAGNGKEGDDDESFLVQNDNNFTEGKSLKDTLVRLENEKDDILIPYMHVDGTSMESQRIILNQARPLLEENAIVVMGVEHSPDLDVMELINFFDQVGYKTFMLGSRQLSRIDNLCPEVLQNVIEHPKISIGKMSSKKRRTFSEILFGKGVPEPASKAAPPFFVALPRGRRMKDEMTIQHCYDLFGGYGGGGGQVKTANDRKAPTVK